MQLRQTYGKQKFPTNSDETLHTSTAYKSVLRNLDSIIKATFKRSLWTEKIPVHSFIVLID